MYNCNFIIITPYNHNEALFCIFAMTLATIIFGYMIYLIGEILLNSKGNNEQTYQAS
jgi:hypothetical protein